MGVLSHHICCEFWLDQYPQECTCGATAKRAPWFDKTEKDYADRMAKRIPGSPGMATPQA